MTTSNWENEEAISFRTRIALKVLFLMFKVLSPYQFEHRFNSEIKALEKELDNLAPKPFKEGE